MTALTKMPPMLGLKFILRIWDGQALTSPIKFHLTPVMCAWQQGLIILPQRRFPALHKAEAGESINVDVQVQQQ